MNIHLCALMAVVLAACNNRQAEPEQQVVSQSPIQASDSVPLTYEDLKSQFNDTNTKISETRIKALYTQICGKGKATGKMDYSRLNAEDLLPAYQNLNLLSALYKDSSSAFLEILESQLSGLDKQHDELDAKNPLDIQIKLKISETKSDIHSHLSELRMKKINHD